MKRWWCGVKTSQDCRRAAKRTRLGPFVLGTRSLGPLSGSLESAGIRTGALVNDEWRMAVVERISQRLTQSVVRAAPRIARATAPMCTIAKSGFGDGCGWLLYVFPVIPSDKTTWACAHRKRLRRLTTNPTSMRVDSKDTSAQQTRSKDEFSGR